MTQPSAPPQLSPDHYYWWTGAAWVPAATHPDGQAALAALQPVLIPAKASHPVVGPAVDAGVFAEQVPDHRVGAAYTGTTHPGWAAPADPMAARALGSMTSLPGDTDAALCLVFGILGFFGVGSILSIRLGKRSHGRNDRAGRPRNTLARVGIVLAWIELTIFVLGILTSIVIPVLLNHHRAHQTSAPGFEPRPQQSFTTLPQYADLSRAVTLEDAHFTLHHAYLGEAGFRQSGFQQTTGSTTTVLYTTVSDYCLKSVSSRNAVSLYFASTSRQISTVPCA